MKFRSLVITPIMGLVALLFMLPVVLMVSTSFKPEGEILNPASAIPKHWTLTNYAYVLQWKEEAPFGRWLLNSVFISTSVTFLVLALASMAAFALVRLNVKGERTILAIIVASLLLPGQLFLIPIYLMLSKLHWLDTPLALIVPATAGGFGVFMLSQFMRVIPKTIDEAALLDGCTPWTLYTNIILPLCAPAMATLGVLTFIASWNDFLGPLVYMDSVRNYTLPVGIALYQSSYYTEYGRTLATSTLATLPLLVVFFVFQKQIIESMATTGLKD